MTAHFYEIAARYREEERHLVLLEAEGDTPATSLGELAILINQGAAQGVIDVGWDSSGLFVDVRLFRDGEYIEAQTTEVMGTLHIRPLGASD